MMLFATVLTKFKSKVPPKGKGPLCSWGPMGLITIFVVLKNLQFANPTIVVGVLWA
jgi:hypothetical protein